MIGLMKEERVHQIIVSISRGSHIHPPLPMHYGYSKKNCARLECLTAVVQELQQDMCHRRFLYLMLSCALCFCCFTLIDRRCIEFASYLSFETVKHVFTLKGVGCLEHCLSIYQAKVWKKKQSCPLDVIVYSCIQTTT